MRNKLNSSRGASLLIAMIVFLVATVVSVVIIDTSLTAARRVKNDTTENQNYLSINSVARLTAACLNESSCTRTERSYQFDPDWTPSVGAENPGTIYPDTDVWTYSGTLGAFFEKLFKGELDADPVLTLNDTKDQISAELTLKLVPDEEDSDRFYLKGWISIQDDAYRLYLYATCTRETSPASTTILTINRDIGGADVFCTETTTVYKCSSVDISTHEEGG